MTKHSTLADFDFPPQRRAAETFVVFALLSLAVWFVYHRALDAPFIFDDSGSVLGNASIVRLWPLVGDESIRGPLNPPPYSATAGRPLVNLSLALNYHFGGFNPRGYHWVNLALHVLSATLLWELVARTLRLPYFAGQFGSVAAPLAFGVAFLWVLHPLATEAVEYVTQRTELLMALCYFATLYFSLRYFTVELPSSGQTWLALAVAACAAGMASKEVMVSAPVVVLLYDRTFIAGSLGAALRRSWPLYLGLAATWVLLAFLNLSGPRSDTAGFHLDVPAHAWWFTQAKVLWMYLGLAILPWPLSISYEMPHVDTLTAAWPYLFALSILLMATFVLLWRCSASGFLAACVFLILAPTFVVPITNEVAAERRMYLPLAAIVTLFTVAGFRWLTRIAPNWPHLPAIVAAIVAIAYGVASANRLEVYRNPIALWQDTLTHQPESAIAHHNLAVALANAGDETAALPHYEEAVRLKPDFLEAQCNLALALARQGQPNEAVEHFRAAVTLKPAADRIRNNLAVMLFSAGRYDEAIIEFQKVIAINPTMWEAHEGLARAYERTDRTDESKRHLDEADRLRQQPGP